MSSRLSKLVAVSSTAVLVLGLAACGGDEPATSKAGSPPASSTSAPAPTPAAGGASQAAFFQKITSAQSTATSSRVSLKIQAAGRTITAQGDVTIGATPADTSMTMSMDMGAAGMGSLKMILIDQALYLNFGEVTGNAYGKIDLTDPSNPLAQQFGSITEQLDPSRQLDQFEGALTSMQKKGDPETIDGVEAQPYELTLDTSKISGPTGTGLPDAVPASLTYTMYIGPDDLPRRVTADVAGSAITVDYTRWGEPVDVKAPPASEVSDTALSGLGLS